MNCCTHIEGVSYSKEVVLFLLIGRLKKEVNNHKKLKVRSAISVLLVCNVTDLEGLPLSWFLSRQTRVFWSLSTARPLQAGRHGAPSPSRGARSFGFPEQELAVLRLYEVEGVALFDEPRTAGNRTSGRKEECHGLVLALAFDLLPWVFKGTLHRAVCDYFSRTNSTRGSKSSRPPPPPPPSFGRSTPELHQLVVLAYTRQLEDRSSAQGG